MLGKTLTGQTAVALALAGLPQTSRPEAEAVLVTATTFVRIVPSVPLRHEDWPGSSRAMVPTSAQVPAVVVPEITQLVTTILVMLTLPVLVTQTVKPMTPPATPLVGGQIFTIANRGVVKTGQVLVALPVTRLLQTSRALTLTISVIEQTFVG